jgi:hypothetical protein
MRSPVEGARDIMIYNVCCTRNFFPSSSVKQPSDEPLSVDTYETISHVSAALSETSANHVLPGDFNIHYPN